jgi:hypothetical protein
MNCKIGEQWRGQEHKFHSCIGCATEQWRRVDRRGGNVIETEVNGDKQQWWTV